MPEWRLSAFAPQRHHRFFRHADASAALAMPGLRSAVLRVDGRGSLRAICPLPALWEFRSPARRAGTSRAGDAGYAEAPFGFSGLSLRSLPAAVFQLAALPANHPFHDARCVAQSLRFLIARMGGEFSASFNNVIQSLVG